MSQRVRTAVFPVAGLGTRFLPATKAVPKELLPVLDTPLIQYAVDEALAAGIDRLVFVNHPSKSAIERHLRHDADLDDTLRARGKDDLADTLADMAACRKAELHFVMQEEPLGLGHAVLQARAVVGDAPFAVVLPDDLILGEPGALTEMLAAWDRVGGHLVAAMEVAPKAVSAYGVLKPLDTRGRLTRASGMVEKPAADKAPSTLAVVGRYVLDGSIFDDLSRQTPGAGGEIQLTDAIAAGIGRVGLAGFAFSGRRFDCGSKAGMLAATLHLAGADADCAQVIADHAPELRALAAE